MFKKILLPIIITMSLLLNGIAQLSIKEKLDMYKSVTLSADLSWLSDKEKQIIPLLFEAGKIMDDIFWIQAYGSKDELLSSPITEYEKQFAIINYGPWERLNGNLPFVSIFGVKPAGANYYPLDMTKEEFEKFDAPDKKSLYTMIRRDASGKLVSLPFSEFFKAQHDKVIKLLLKAADLAEDNGFKEYLTSRAEAFKTNNYQPSDYIWMDMKTSNIDLVIGPIENYEDALFGYKAANECFILIKDLDWSKKLSRFTAMLPDIQKNLPVEYNYKQEQVGSESDLYAYDAIYYAGDCNAGSKTIAINLPNDEEVQLKKGSRRLQLKNIMKAKFDNIMMPISDLLISANQKKYLKFNAFFENVMFHEVAHGLGIKNTINGNGTVRDALKEQYSSIEEGKADILGLYIVTKLYEIGELKEGDVMDNYVTFLAGIFRSCRFGASSAHGKANMVRFYYFEEKGAFTRNSDGTYSVNFDKMKEAVISSVQNILKIQGDGDYAAAKKTIEKDGYIKEELQKDLNRINEAKIPVDIIFNQGIEYLKF